MLIVLDTTVRRHWKELMQITGVQLDLTPEVFRLQHLLDAKLMSHRDEVSASGPSVCKHGP